MGIFGPIKALNLYLPQGVLHERHEVSLIDAGAQIITLPRIQKRGEQVSYADYQMDEILQEFVTDDKSKIPSKEELKEQIRKDTKMVSNNEVPEVQSDSN